jgi:YegS/Rv2252/BmrU family lipid kinase
LNFDRMTRMKVRAIVNPISGRRSLAAVVKRLSERLLRHGVSLEVTPTTKAGDATRLAAEASRADTRAIVAVGGDGTVREVVEGLIGGSVPLAVLPGGTENVLAKHFGFRVDADELARTILRGEEEAYDVGVCGDRRFILMVGAGFDADVVRALSEARKGHISYWSYVRPFWNTFCRHGFPVLKVEVDGRAVYEGRAMVWAGIIPRYSMGMRILHRARTDDGLLDVCILPCASRTRLTVYGALLMARRAPRHARAQYHQCRHVRVTSDVPVNIQIDGDPAGTLPVECGILDRGLRLLRPAK